MSVVGLTVSLGLKSQMRQMRHLFSVRQADALAALAAEGPEVEGALDVVADDATADGEVGAKVRTVGV